MCLITVKDAFSSSWQSFIPEMIIMSSCTCHCALTAVKMYTFRLLWHSIELDACQRFWLVLCSLTLVSLFTSAMIKCFTTTQQIILNELSSTRLQLRSSCLTLCHNTPSSFSQPTTAIPHEQSRYMQQWAMITVLAGGKWEVWKSSTIINDVAERGVALIQAFIGVLTKRNSSYCKS